MQPSDDTQATRSRREFVGASLAAGSILAGGLWTSRAHAAGSDVLRVGLVGCGGRGTGAANDAMKADPGVRLVALGDVFPEKVESARNHLAKIGGEQFAVDADHVFSGFDAYQGVIAASDVVLLATPPHFRPLHLEAAVAAGKHIFAEKPVAVDAPGVRRVIAAAEQARQKNLALVTGLCWRYHKAMQETVRRVQEGAVGDIVSLQCNYNVGYLWNVPRQSDWSDMEWQLRNWLYFTWLSGDHNVEQHIHSIDKMAWVMGDQYPTKAVGLGGRQVRIEPKWGNIFDHHAVVYEFANGVRCHSYCRQQDNTRSDVSDWVYGTQGVANLMEHSITGPNAWKHRPKRGESDNMYLQEHQALFSSIRSGQPRNDGDIMTKSTLMAIMGRMATYTGQEISWEQALNSTEDLSPPSYTFGPLSVAPVAMPGRTKFV